MFECTLIQAVKKRLNYIEHNKIFIDIKIMMMTMMIFFDTPGCLKHVIRLAHDGHVQHAIVITAPLREGNTIIIIIIIIVVFSVYKMYSFHCSFTFFTIIVYFPC